MNPFGGALVGAVATEDVRTSSTSSPRCTFWSQLTLRDITGAESLNIGDPMSWDTEIGSMVSGDQFELVRELVDDAVAGGASLRCGGPVPGPAGGVGGDFFAPTVLTGVTHEMRIMREEIFGPVRPIMVVDSDDEAVGLATTACSASAPRSGRLTAARASGSRAS